MNIKYNLTKLKGKIIAIDGPAGSGKSTTAKLVADRLGYTYLDTGAMYRALTYYALKNNISPSDERGLAEVMGKLSIRFENKENIQHVFLGDEDVTIEIRTPEVTRQVSEVSAHKKIRKAMVEKQKELGQKGSIVAEGRDTTTVVFTNAHLKIYLKATIEQRAQRRLIDLAKMGVTTTLQELKEDIKRRDDYDSNRQHSPLTIAPDAIVIDTSHLTIEDQVEKIISLAIDKF
ncbi:MAG: (d)CMP kinase [bacterium]